MDLELKDRFGIAVEPREWFLIPLPIILDIVEKLKDGSLAKYAYEAKEARLVEISRV